MVALRPTCSQAQTNLGLALDKNGDLDGAITSYKQAISIDPNYVDARERLAAAFRAKHDAKG